MGHTGDDTGNTIILASGSARIRENFTKKKVLGVRPGGNHSIVRKTLDLKRPEEWPVHTRDNYKQLEKNVHGSAAIYQDREICFGRVRNACRALVKCSFTTFADVSTSRSSTINGLC